jgi:hypothetical protein
MDCPTKTWSSQKKSNSSKILITHSTNLGRRKGRLFQYAEHNVQGSDANQAAFLKLVPCEKAEGDKLVLFFYPITHQFALFCDAL